MRDVFRRPVVRSVLSIVVAVVLTAVATHNLWGPSADAVWDPLGPYVDQTVTADGTVEFQGEQIPTIHLGDPTYTVIGRKCYREDVTVTGTTSYSSISPPGLTLTFGQGSGSNDHPEGCVRGVFVNLLPETVITWAEQRIAEGQPFVVVRYIGVETARSPAHEGPSAEATWRTEPFAIVAETP